MTNAAHTPTLVFIIGPPAVGKMTVGVELARRTGLKLFHNHHTIDLVLEFFPFGSPPFGRLVREFRHRIMEEVAASTLPGLVFTYVWAFDHPAEAPAVAEMAEIFSSRGGRVVYVELQATLQERLRRNETEFRRAQKASKRDVEKSRRILLQHDAEYRLNSAGEFDHRPDWLRIENTDLLPGDVAEQIIRHFSLPLAADPDAAGALD
jgi:hypothetical protein